MVHTVDWMHDAALKTGYIKTGPTFRNLRRYCQDILRKCNNPIFVMFKTPLKESCTIF